MISKYKFFYLLLFCLLTTLPFAHANKIKQFTEAFASNVQKNLTAESIPGGAYVIVRGDAIIDQKHFGYTDKTKRRSIDDNTVFRLASVSKTFAATLTTMLAFEQHLSLSDPITKYVPSFKLAKAGDADKIELAHILSQSSGIMPNAFDNLLHENWSMNKIIKQFKRINPICKPNQCYGYQNITYGLLEQVIELSQQKTYKTLLNERIFEPLNMKNASLGINVYQQKNSNTAKPHVLVQRKKTAKKNQKGLITYQYIWRTVKVRPDFYKVPAAAGVNASITDLSEWLMANLGYKPKVLSPALLKLLTTPKINTKKDLKRRFWRKYLTDAHYALGWRVYQFKGHPIIYHGGWVEGFRAEIGYCPTLNIGFAFLINAESNIISQLSSNFWSKAIEIFKKRSRPPSTIIHEKTLR